MSHFYLHFFFISFIIGLMGLIGLFIDAIEKDHKHNLQVITDYFLNSYLKPSNKCLI